MDLKKPTAEEAKEAVKTLLRFIGEDPNREGLLKTPDRVIKTYQEVFSGYDRDVEEILTTKFYDTCNFQDFIVLKDIYFNSFCEHHMLPITGTVNIAYIPDNCIIGISKLARIVDVFARRLQIQEKMTVQIAETLQKYIKPLGVAVKISALHSCMTLRGVMQNDSIMNTMHYTGIYRAAEISPRIPKYYFQKIIQGKLYVTIKIFFTCAEGRTSGGTSGFSSVDA